MYIRQIDILTPILQSSNIQKIFSIFNNMKNMTQNIQNGYFDIKRGSRILRIIGATKWAISPSISSYKRGVGAVPPPRFGLNLYAKNVIDVF